MSQTLQLPEGTQIEVFGAMVAVLYPYRKSKALYIDIEGHDTHCCTGCETPDFWPGLFSLVNHIRRHDRRKTVQRQQLHGPDEAPSYIKAKVSA